MSLLSGVVADAGERQRRDDKGGQQREPRQVRHGGSPFERRPFGGAATLEIGALAIKVRRRMQPRGIKIP